MERRVARPFDRARLEIRAAMGGAVREDVRGRASAGLKRGDLREGWIRSSFSSSS